MVWDVVPDPKGTDHYAETTWMLRAAQVALQGEAAPGRAAGAARIIMPPSDSPRDTRDRALPDRRGPRGRGGKARHRSAGTCEVPYYFGVRAQGEKRFGDAADWYRVAVECGMRQEAEYLFAWNELYRLRGRKDVFARLRSTIR